MSDARSGLLKKLSRLSSEIGFFEFDAKNTGQNYKYASAAMVLRTINKKMAEIGLTASSQSSVTHFEVEKYEEGGKHKCRHHCVVHTELRIFDVETGEFIMSRGVGSGLDSGDKAAMKAETAGEKYAWRALLTLGWGAEDPEADASTDKIGKTESGGKNVKAAIKAAKTWAELEPLKAQILALPEDERPALIEQFKAHKAYQPPSN